MLPDTKRFSKSEKKKSTHVKAETSLVQVEIKLFVDFPKTKVSTHLLIIQPTNDTKH